MSEFILKAVKEELLNQGFEHADLLEIPPVKEFGDLSIPVFKLAKTLRKNPKLIAANLSEKINNSGIIEKVEVKGPYVNIFINKGEAVNRVINSVLTLGIKYGAGKKSENVMVEFSQPNTHKGFHIGHDRNTVLGDSLAKIMNHAGYKVLRANYPGDIGMHIAKVIWYMKKFKPEMPEDANKGEWLGELYAKANKALKDNDDFMDEASKVHNDLEFGVPELVELWKKTRQWSLDEFNRIYDELGVSFDVWFFESEVQDAGKEIAKRLLERKVAEISDGALLVNLEKYNLGVFLILKSSGASLYSTKDLELARRKFEEYNIDRSIYVVGSEQKFYFQQLFKTLELMGFKQAENCYHLSYGLVVLPTGKMSSRAGGAILHSQVLQKLFEIAVKEVKSRNPEMSDGDVSEIARVISISALKYSLLKVSPNKNIVFSWDKVLDFNGDTAPYLLYSAVRAGKIVKDKDVKLDGFVISDPVEAELALKFSEFSKVINQAASKYKPNLVANYLYDLCKLFNEFYNKCQVVGSEHEESRLMLVKAFNIIIRSGLGLLGMSVPNRM